MATNALLRDLVQANMQDMLAEAKTTWNMLGDPPMQIVQTLGFEVLLGTRLPFNPYFTYNFSRRHEGERPKENNTTDGVALFFQRVYLENAQDVFRRGRKGSKGLPWHRASQAIVRQRKKSGNICTRKDGKLRMAVEVQVESQEVHMST